MSSVVPLSHGSVQAALRVLQPLLHASALRAPTGETLERIAMAAEPPSVAPCTPLEPAGTRRVSEATVPIVAAFLDGIQRTRVLGFLDGTPLVHATVAAAVRQREQRQLRAWHEPVVHQLLLASLRALGPSWWRAVEDAGLQPVDIDLPDGEDADLHPHAFRTRALSLVALEREQLERRLAARWVAEEQQWLWIDGGIAGNLALDVHTPAFGVVKSHNTLYGDRQSIRDILALRKGERSPAFLVGHRVRRAVASWYLRWHDAEPSDPLFGLVRVEVVPPTSLPDGDEAARRAFTATCDALSSAILLERHPVSLPDSRWHTLAYGVHAVETYLKALIGT